jgi:hypothetical protein
LKAERNFKNREEEEVAMTTNPTANQLAGRAIGSMFFAGFGALWLFLFLYAKEILSVRSVAGLVLGLVLLLAAAVSLLRESKRWPRIPNDPRMGKVFGWINAIQWIAVAAVAFSFAKLHIDAYVMSAITAIVGLHMFPLARLFHYSLHYATGAVLTAWAAVSALLLPIDQMQGLTALGTGIILWLSAAVTLTMAMQVARRAAPTQSGGEQTA